MEYTKYNSLLSDMNVFCKYFSPSVAFFLILLTLPFAEQKIFVLMKSSLWTVYFMDQSWRWVNAFIKRGKSSASHKEDQWDTLLIEKRKMQYMIHGVSFVKKEVQNSYLHILVYIDTYITGKIHKKLIRREKLYTACIYNFKFWTKSIYCLFLKKHRKNVKPLYWCLSLTVRDDLLVLPLNCLQNLTSAYLSTLLLPPHLRSLLPSSGVRSTFPTQLHVLHSFAFEIPVSFLPERLS